MERGFIYCVTCLVNGKQYIGQTVKPVFERWGNHIRSSFRGSDHKFHRAIRKYGEENFTVEEVMWVEAPTKQALKAKLDFLEIHFIQKFDTHRHGYNSTDGGEGKLGFRFSEESRRKMSEAAKGRKSPFKGKKHSFAAKMKMVQSHLGKKLPNETRQKMSEVAKRRYAKKRLLIKEENYEHSCAF